MRLVAIMLAWLASCGTCKGERMTARTWDQDHYGEQQYGQSLQVIPTSGTLVTVAKDVVRWRGEPWDVRPWRVYLGPWQPRPDISIIGIPAANDYAFPTPWNTPPNNYNSMQAIQLLARVSFGSGGVAHTAYVDWPQRGLLFQVAGNYLQVDGVGQADVTDPSSLPILGATLAPEPGGGDAIAPATYTYRLQVSNPNGEQLFQVPPWARTFAPLLDRAALIAGGATTITIRTYQKGSPFGFGDPEDSWFFPLAGDEAPEPLPISTAAGLVRITIGAPPATTLIGCLFQLDL